MRSTRAVPNPRQKMPSDIAGRLTPFDRFASRTSDLVSRAWFFVLCVLIVVAWMPTVWVMPSIDTWQLVINTVTTIITFLLVALLHNTETRADGATQRKLNAIADGLSDLMDQLGREYPELHRHRDELDAAVGLETREGAE